MFVSILSWRLYAYEKLFFRTSELLLFRAFLGLESNSSENINIRSDSFIKDDLKINQLIVFVKIPCIFRKMQLKSFQQLLKYSRVRASAEDQ